jgi:Zn-dependent peptidase ImmA (M78 family)
MSGLTHVGLPHGLINLGGSMKLENWLNSRPKIVRAINLCKKHGFTIKWQDEGYCACNPEHGYIKLSTRDTEHQLLCGILHELGHMLDANAHKYMADYRCMNVLEREEEAWKYARALAKKHKFGTLSEQHIQYCLSTYGKKAA